MMSNYKLLALLPSIFLIQFQSISQVLNNSAARGNQGITLVSESSDKLLINSSLEDFQFEDVSVEGTPMKAVRMTGVILPNESGSPDLPAASHYIAIPQEAVAKFKVLSSRTELITGVDVAPAPVIPLDTDREPLQYRKNPQIYSRNEFYPANPVVISEPFKIRGVDVVMLSITPFQYNPVTRELIVYRDLEVDITMEGGNGKVGDDRLQSRWWDPLIKGAVLNPGAIPETTWESSMSSSRTTGFEYLIIVPDMPEFIQWADSIKYFRICQGISTGVVTTTQVGGNTTDAIKTYVTNAYNTWDIPPVAVLLLGDYSTGSDGITSYFYPHPSGSYPNYPSDNYYADVTNDDLPDMIFARITARNAAELQVMVTKFLNYERTPPTDYNFYDKPVTALGWQTERWFQICSETIGGYFLDQGKNPVRINALYIGNPDIDPWSTAYNTATIVNYFGPTGLGYIPATPQELGGFTGGTGSQIVNAINDGTFLIQHRDHGMYTGWGEPSFTNTQIGYLTNVGNELPYVLSINCQTGAFHNTSECFAEKFHRKTYNGQNSGALGILAATEVSYSYVNDTYIWGVIDNMFPDFMPEYTTQFPTSFVMPAFGNASGKYFLYQSSWPYNTGSKQVTYRLFHHHGDAFMTLFTEVPQVLTVAHSSSLVSGETSFTVTADTGASIALTVNNQIIATAIATGSAQSINIPVQNGGQTMYVTVTKQNYFRYSAPVAITAGGVVAYFSAGQTSVCAGTGITFTDASYGPPSSWTWSFPGGNPSAYQGQNPPVVAYNNAGTYDVSLTVSNSSSSDTESKTGYITVAPLTAGFSGTPVSINPGQSVTFTDLSSCSPTSWEWSFPGGSPATYSGQAPPAISYGAAGSYNVSLIISNGSVSETMAMNNYINVNDVYCSGFGNATQEWISSFTLNGQTNPSGSGGNIGYQDFTNVSFPLQSGSSYNISITPTFAGTVRTEYFKIWIDYNNDGDFIDAGEEVFSAAKKKTTTTGSIAIPAGLNVTTRMRVFMKRNVPPVPCDTYTTGEAEDYTIVITPPPPQPPVADFTGNPTTVITGSTVQFNDQSANNPLTWSWTFEGGLVTTEDSQNPAVQYNTPGTYAVTLVVTNEVGEDIEIKSGYIVVSNQVPEYCEPASINNTADFINTITLGSVTHASGQGATGFIYYQAPDFSFTPGQSYSISLSPYVATNRNYWRIWIDINGDGDFTDSDELMYTINNKKGTATGTITIPAYAAGSTRMRVSMKTLGTQNPCDDGFNGEVEDYNVNFGTDDFFTPAIPGELVMIVYPNPAKDLINIDLPGNSSRVLLHIYNSLGNVIRSAEISGDRAKIDMTDYKPGLYFIKADDGNMQVVRKIILE
jgi:PKD repeat protein